MLCPVEAEAIHRPHLLLWQVCLFVFAHLLRVSDVFVWLYSSLECDLALYCDLLSYLAVTGEMNTRASMLPSCIDELAKAAEVLASLADAITVAVRTMNNRHAASAAQAQASISHLVSHGIERFESCTVNSIHRRASSILEKLLPERYEAFVANEALLSCLSAMCATVVAGASYSVPIIEVLGVASSAETVLRGYAFEHCTLMTIASLAAGATPTTSGWVAELPGCLTLWHDSVDEAQCAITGVGLRSFVKGALMHGPNSISVVPRTRHGSLAGYVRAEDVQLVITGPQLEHIEYECTVREAVANGFDLVYTVSSECEHDSIRVAVEVCGLRISPAATAFRNFTGSKIAHVRSIDIPDGYVSTLDVSADGCSAAVSYHEENVVRVFALLPTPALLQTIRFYEDDYEGNSVEIDYYGRASINCLCWTPRNTLLVCDCYKVSDCHAIFGSVHDIDFVTYSQRDFCLCDHCLYS